ncbi:hypothetical protein [Endozoicomonas ascidiicola]|uniref:hypothetical protein n=1 Tax=Endozoicomonas ascidiicola TaxID=1698521 RepID=UPI0008379682|nr:hypothetical protein [Endozoicomonas ascidiicola]
MRLIRLLGPLQQAIDTMSKGSTFKVSTLLMDLDLWESRNDLHNMRTTMAFKALVEDGLLENIQLLTLQKTKHAVYLTY